MIIIITTIIFNINSVSAFYSPLASQTARSAKDHIKESRRVNGKGDLAIVVDNLLKKDSENRKLNKTVAIKTEAAEALTKVASHILEELFLAPLDSITMIFNYILSENSYISMCLRDDIWMLESLKDMTAKEGIKAYMLGDSTNGNILFDDYDKLRLIIRLLKKYGNRPHEKNIETGIDEELIVKEKDKTIKELFYFSNDADYYYTDASYDGKEVGCPGEFMPAIKEIVNAYDGLSTTITTGGEGWGDLAATAKRRGEKKAAAWIEKNQIKVSIKGEKGGNPMSVSAKDIKQSIIKNGNKNLAKITGVQKSNLETAKSLIGIPAKSFTWDKWRSKIETEKGIDLTSNIDTTSNEFWIRVDSLFEKNTFWEKSCAIDNADIKKLKEEGGNMSKCTEEQLEAYMECAIYNSETKKYNPCTEAQYKIFKEGKCEEKKLKCVDPNAQRKDYDKV